MSNFFQRLSAARANEFKTSFGALVGIAQGILCDHQLNDDEIRFLNDWLTNNEAASTEWPGDVIFSRVRQVLADGRITGEERDYLVNSLNQLVGGKLEKLADNKHVTQLALDDVQKVTFSESLFCLTGDFVFAPRERCVEEIRQRGGAVGNSVTKKLRYLVVGGLGSSEWKHGSFGTKIETAIRYKREGLPILIVHEDVWANSL